MSVNLSKGGSVSLTKEAGKPVRNLVVACGWDPKSGDGNMDLDLVTACLGTNGKVSSDDWFVYYGNRYSPGSVVVVSPDNLTGTGDGDDESVNCQFDRIPADIVTLDFAVNIYSGARNFGQVKNAFVRIYDANSGTELAKYALSDGFSKEDFAIFGSIVRVGDDWEFRAVGQGMSAKQFRKDRGISKRF